MLGSARVTIPVVLGLLLLAGGGVYAAYRYDASTQNRILPGVTIAGVDVGGMTRKQAVGAVKQTVADTLARQVEVQAAGESWPITLDDLGTTSDFREVVDLALAVNGEFTWMERSFRRLLDRPLDRAYELSYTYNEGRISRFVQTVADQVKVSPTNAAVDFVDGQLVLRRPEKGKELRVKHAQDSLMEALATQEAGT